jgi:hypothetical protein
LIGVADVSSQKFEIDRARFSITEHGAVFCGMKINAAWRFTMTIAEQNDTQIPKLDREVLEILENLPGPKLLGAGSPDATTRLAFISASGGYTETSGSFTGWITYGLFERKIRFQSTKFTTRMLSFVGAGGFLNAALPLERLAGQTGTFAMSGNREISALRLWLGNELVCAPLILVGGGGNGHLGEGEVVFRAVD